MCVPARPLGCLFLLSCLLLLNCCARAQGQDQQTIPAHTQEETRRVEHMPEFRGNLGNWMVAHLKYPSKARRAGQQGRALVKFVVDTDGQVTGAHIFKSSGYEQLDAEALRVVREMPVWRPGSQEGKPVKVYYTLPVVFRLE